MATLKISGLSKSFGIHTVFENISFDVRSGERIGLVGANGAGKTTLLRCIIGTEEADKGSVKADSGAVIGYLRQDFNYSTATLREEMEEAWKDILFCEDELHRLAAALEKDQGNEELISRYGRLEARFEFLGGYQYRALTKKILTGLGFREEDWDRDIHSFSGGQKVRINLAAALVRHPDFLLLDEPTNHLDMGMLEWLEEYLRSYKGGILMVSHDRYFLDAVATGIIDLENCHIRSFRGGYTRYQQTKAQQDAAYEKAYEKQQEHIKETEEYIRRYKAGIKSKQARGRQSQLDRLERLEAPKHRKSMRFHFTPPEECADRVLDVLHGTAAYGEHVIFRDVSFQIRKGESVGLIGPNGAGKTTLLKLVTGDKKPSEGLVQLGSNVQPGYYSQEQEALDPKLTVLEQVEEAGGCGEGEARNLLGMFLFRGDDVFKSISLLSGGEKARLSLLLLFLSRPNFLILDEPTNHLDIPTREVMEEAIEAFGGTCFIVSHDRYFLDKVVTRILEMDGGKLTEYLGNYTYYREKKKDLEEFERDRQGAAEEAKPAAAAPEEKTTRPAAEEKKELTPAAAEKISRLEMEIARQEAALKMYEMEMNAAAADPAAYAEAAARYGEEEKKLDALYEKWEAAAE